MVESGKTPPLDGGRRELVETAEYPTDHDAPMRARSRRRRTRGQALVEFALVAPVFFTLIFGFIEFALIEASIGSYNFAAKDSARLGSLIGPTDPQADQKMIALIQSRVNGVVFAKVIKVEIYKSDAAGDYLQSGSLPPEDVYDANGNAVGSATWPPTLRNDTLIDADYLGVRITFKYNYMTSYLGGGNASLQLTANSVQRIEPQDFQSWIRHAPPALALAVHARSPISAFGWPPTVELAVTPTSAGRFARREPRRGGAG